MASIRKLALEAGTSVATVSRALNGHAQVSDDARRRVLDAAARMGYSKSVGKRSTTVIGLAYPGDPVRADYGAFESALLAGILRGINEHRFDLHIINLQRDKRTDENFTQFFNRKGLRGVILRTFERSREMCVEIAAEGFASVVVADRFDEPFVNFACCESKGDSRRAVEHLIHLGHKRIALVVHNIPDTDHRDRREGYVLAMKEHNLPVDPALVIETSASMEGGAGAITRLLGQKHPPTAVFLTDPMATLGAIRRCQELAVVLPTELSLVGFDDSDVRRHVWPPVTAVCQDADMLGYEAALWLTRRLSGKAEGSLRLVRQTMFEINRTTGAPPRTQVRVLPDGRRVSID
ncbi:MAG: LacI family DNA-binding transcriptional regulator [Phycisphaerales bacterium]